MPVDKYNEMSDAKYWSNLDIELSDRIELDSVTKIEDQPGALNVNFANKYIGGGALTHGKTQEEVLFLVYPELYPSILMCPKMDQNEAILIKNAWKTNRYSGYNRTLKFEGTVEGEVRNDILAIDALYYGT